MGESLSTFLSPVGLLIPQQIEFGAGTAAQIADWSLRHECHRPLIVADTFNATRFGTLGFSGSPAIFSDIKAEPDADDLERLLRCAETVRPDVVVGFGGGSAMDMAKLAAVMPRSGQTLYDVAGAERVHARTSRLVQVPTTAGTGSEVGTRALITDPTTRNKLAVQSVHMLADLAVIDPLLTVTVPSAVTAATGVDALAHCVESYTSKKAHPLIDIYALEGIRLIGRYLPRAIADGADVEARAALAMAAMFGGICLGPVNTAGGHALSYPLGTRHHIAHGAANALIFPHVLAFNLQAVPERTAAILDALRLAPAETENAVLGQAGSFCERLGLVMQLSRLGVPRDDLVAMTEEAFAIRRLLDNNPRELTHEDILAIYQAAY